MCVSPTFASPIEKPATSAPRRICREIIGNTKGNAKIVDSLRHCKWPNLASKSAPETKKPTKGPVGGEFSKWSTILELFRTFLSTSKRRIFQIPQDGLFSLSRKILRLDFYSVNFYNFMRLHRKLYNLSPDDFERSFGLNGIQKPGTNV